MDAKTTGYFNRLRSLYAEYNDQDSLNALAELSERDNRVRELKIYREQQFTQDLIRAALERYKICLEMLTNPEKSKQMSDYDRAYCFAAMDWAKYTLDIVGESPEHAEKMVSQMVESYVRTAGIS